MRTAPSLASLAAVPLAAALLAGAARSQDPSSSNELDEARRTHPLLGRIELLDLPSAGAFRIVYEPPRRPNPAHATRVNELFVPWLAQLTEIVQEELLERADLVPRPDAGRPALIVFGQSATLANAARYADLEPGVRVGRWHDLDAIVTWWDKSQELAGGYRTRAPVLREAVSMLLGNCDLRITGELNPGWLVVGLAEAFSAHDDAQPDALQSPPLSPAALERLEDALADPDRRAKALVSLSELVAADGAVERGSLAQASAQAAGIELDGDEEDAWYAEQSALWVHFLMWGEGGRRRHGLLEHLGAVLADSGTEANLAGRLEVNDLSELEDAYRAHVAAHAGFGPPVEVGPIDASAEALPHPELLPPPRTDHEQATAALAHALSGDLEAALDRMEAARDVARSLYGKELLEAECVRLAAAIEARDARISALVGSGSRLRLTIDGRGSSHEVEGVEDGELLLDGRRGVDSVRIVEIPPADLARMLERVGPPTVVAYLELLGGSDGWEKRLDDSPESEALRGQAEDMTRVVAEARARAALRLLAAEETPEGTAEVQAFLGRLGATVREHGQTETLRSARKVLREHTTGLLQAVFEGQGLTDRLEGRIETEPSGVVRVAYEFDRPEELADFVQAPGYLPDRAAKLPPTGLGPGENETVVRGGNLEVQGSVVLRHMLPMTAPIRVRYEVLYGRARPGKERAATILVAICDDGAGNYVGAWDIFDLEAIDIESGNVALAYTETDRILVPARSYAIELSHTGKGAVLLVGGQKIQEVATGPRDTGSLLLWFHTDVYLALRKLEVEGTVAPDAIETVRDAWVEERLVELGL